VSRVPVPHRFEVTAWMRDAMEPCFSRIVANIDEAALVESVLERNHEVAVWEIASFTSGMISWRERVPLLCIRDFGKRYRVTNNRRDPLLDLLWCSDGHGWFVGAPGAPCPWCLIESRRTLAELEAELARLEARERRRRRRLRRGE